MDIPKTSFTSKVIPYLQPVIAMILFSIALWVLYGQAQKYHYQDIVDHFLSIPSLKIWLAIGLTTLSYLILTGYDRLAILYLGQKLSYPKIALASFLSYTFSYNMGFALVTGGSIRYRLYSSWGFNPIQIAQLILFCGLTLFVGLFASGGMALLFAPKSVAESFHLSTQSINLIAAICLIKVLLYFLVITLRKKPLMFRGYELPLPSVKLSLVQLIISIIDWVVAAGVLFVLLPSNDNVSFFLLLTAFMGAQIIGVMSHVPGGLGVFETAITFVLAPLIPADEVLGALVAYRVIYYLGPFLVGLSVWAIYEALQKKKAFLEVSKDLHKWAKSIVPPFLAFSVFFGGIILLVSGATPALEDRLHWLQLFIPLPVMEISHFLGSIIGASLLILAYGLRKRYDAAYFSTLILLGLGIVFSLLKAFDYEEALILTVFLICLAPCRSYFFRKSSFLNAPLTPEWLVATAGVAIAILGIGFFSYRHIEYSNDLWWQFTFIENAPRFMRAGVGVLLFFLGYAVLKLLRSSPPQFTFPDATSIPIIKKIISQSSDSKANLALMLDKFILFNTNQNAFIMFGIEKKSWVVLGDPLGPKEEHEELIWKFRELCDQHDARPVFYEVRADNVPTYLEMGLNPLKIGEEARVPLDSFDLEGSYRSELRQSRNRAEREGLQFEIVSVENVPLLLPELKTISNIWLSEKSVTEKGFSLGRFEEGYMKNFPVALIRQNGKIIAFSNIWESGDHDELSIDLMRYLPKAPNGTMEYLFVRLMLWGRENGYHWFNLGMAPLSGFEDRPLNSLWNKIGRLIFEYGGYFYSFKGLQHFKEKFDPVWEPRYLVCPAGLKLPRVLANLTTLISGGMSRVLKK
ncbi:MAG: phosphatidylglycerol lysyltransferase [Nitrospinales bacterium]|jgi:phosphatidylglycerol lysyltransferase